MTSEDGIFAPALCELRRPFCHESGPIVPVRSEDQHEEEVVVDEQEMVRRRPAILIRMGASYEPPLLLPPKARSASNAHTGVAIHVDINA